MEIIDAFISYTHQDASLAAKSIQHSLENLGKPWYKIRRARTIYRDQTSLPGGGKIADKLQHAIQQSKYFILLATPEVLHSNYINLELEIWFASHQASATDNLIILLLDGEIDWDPIQKDFNWHKTNSLPELLAGKFDNEPLWVDMTKHVYREQKQLQLRRNNNSNYELAKVVASMTGREPRAIASAEIRRSRQISLGLILACLLVIASISGFLLMLKQRHTSTKYAKSKALTAAANAIKEKNISKALILFAYAYQANQNAVNFKQLDDYYQTNLVHGDVFDSHSPSFYRRVKFNPFYRQIKTADTPLDTNYDPVGYFQYFGFLEKMHQYYTLINDSVQVYSLNKKLQKIIPLPFKRPFRGINGIQPEIVYYLFPKKDTLLAAYDIASNRLKPILLRKDLDTYPGPEKDSLKTLFFHTIRLQVSPSENGRYLLFYKEKNMGEGKQLLALIDVVKRKLDHIWLNNPDESRNSFFNDSLLISNDAKKLIRVAHPDNQTEHKHYFYSLGKTQKVLPLINIDIEGDMLPELPTYYRWCADSNHFIFGTEGGRVAFCFIPQAPAAKSASNQIARQDQFISKIYSSPSQQISQITALDYSKDLIFAGTNRGVLDIFLNQSNLPRSVSLSINGFSNLLSIQLPSDYPVKKINYESKNGLLYVLLRNGEIYQLNTHQPLKKLSPNLTLLFSQLFKQLYLADLTISEKKQFKIP
ncbi:toll/interleukin-1 receptor domain-containing protein [Pedobacter aquatilis]|uniref:toll/interleukin-1 receptor domain-containing protein n=1 Tax=Pedobacter aquatilis TaxID=351343 RepID=UPI00292E3092|nr:toll/interleukin-1 receptor domain-containing protein [Pedobacter aquatilis]